MSAGRFGAVTWVLVVLVLLLVRRLDRVIGSDDPDAPRWRRRWLAGRLPVQRDVGFACALLLCAWMAAAA